MHLSERKVEVKIEVERFLTLILTFLRADFLQNYTYLCTPIKRRAQNDKDNFS
jgi:hypothetical protein